ncbi:hypothetical protein MNBD_BACTEROID05-315, partial [hydrothermal vent metagenome]
GLDEDTYQAIKDFSRKTHISMNKFIVNLLKKTVGTSQGQVNKDFDSFFGTWKDKDVDIVLKSSKSLRKVDKGFWK